MHCDYCRFIWNPDEELRLLPYTGGELPGNDVVCRRHFIVRIADRCRQRLAVTADFDPFPNWEDLALVDKP